MGTWSYSIAGDTDRHQFQARCLCESRYAGETATKHIEFNSVGNAGRDSSFLKQETNLRGVDLIGVLFKGIVYYIISFKIMVISNTSQHKSCAETTDVVCCCWFIFLCKEETD